MFIFEKVQNKILSQAKDKTRVEQRAFCPQINICGFMGFEFDAFLYRSLCLPPLCF
jgi:hypothetical protein